jgi:hypothetical protein
MTYQNTITSNSRVFLDWTSKDNVRRSGVHTPDGTKLVTINSTETGDTVVLKVPGHKYSYGSRNSLFGQAYAPAEFEVYFVPELKTATSGWAYPITSFNVKS